MKFRKKPIVIDALQLRWDTWSEMCDFAGVGKLEDGKPEGCFARRAPDDMPVRQEAGPDDVANTIGLKIPTLEGLMVATEGDWIIRGVKGELYPCRADIFEATYEPVDAGGIVEPVPVSAAPEQPPRAADVPEAVLAAIRVALEAERELEAARHRFGQHATYEDLRPFVFRCRDASQAGVAAIATALREAREQGAADTARLDGRLAFAVQYAVAEVSRAMRKFPTWPSDPFHALAVLGEEVGELTKAIVEHTYEPHKSSREDVATEAMQVAAMALRFLISVQNGCYVFQGGAQHHQLDAARAAEPEGSDA